jgi:Lysylphosphatidylglycerol synthase TM region
MALAWVLGLGLLGWLLIELPWHTAWAALQRPSASVWALVLAALLLSYVIRGARLQVVMGLASEARSVRTVMGLRTDALRVILMHNAAVNLLPMRAGELSFPWLASRELQMPLPRAVACLIWMRVQDLMVLAWLGLLAWPDLPVSVRAAGIVVLVLAGLGLGWLSSLASRPQAHHMRWAKWQSALAEPSHHRPAAWALTLANWMIKLSAGACLLAAITGASWLTAWAGALGGELAAVVPLQGPAGFGTYEAGVWAAMAWLTPAGDATLDHAVTGALCLHACFLVCATLAGLLAWLMRPTWAHDPADAPRPADPLSS